MDRFIPESEQQTHYSSEEFNENHLENLLCHADHMLDTTLTEIALKYASHTFLVIHCYNRGKVKEHIEVRFETEGADLTCNFDEEKKCEGVMLFFDRLDECVHIYKEYVDYLNSKYMHIEEQFYWKLPQGALALLTNKNRMYLGYFRGLEVPQKSEIFERLRF